MKCIHLIMMILILISCNQNNPQDLSQQEIETIKKEIRNRVDGYFEAVQVINLEEVFDFWSNSQDFVFAGDGKILGGYEEWVNALSKWAKTTDHYIYWNNSNIKIEVLSRNAASYTMEFDIKRFFDTIDHNLLLKAGPSYLQKE